MKNIHSFSLDSLNDKSLETLYNDVCRELNARAEAKAAKRAGWVREMNYLYLLHPNATHMTIGEITVVSVFNRNTGMRMATARPVHGDAFDSAVGLAVAYAKANGMTVPDYI